MAALQFRVDELWKLRAIVEGLGKLFNPALYQIHHGALFKVKIAGSSWIVDKTNPVKQNHANEMMNWYNCATVTYISPEAEYKLMLFPETPDYSVEAMETIERKVRELCPSILR